MTINLSLPETDSTLKPKIMVVGVGGAGGNAVNNMINSKLAGVEFLVANTDAQSLVQSFAERIKATGYPPYLIRPNPPGSDLLWFEGPGGVHIEISSTAEATSN